MVEALDSIRIRSHEADHIVHYTFSEIKTAKACTDVTHAKKSKKYCHTLHTYKICKQMVSGGFNCAKITAYASPQCKLLALMLPGVKYQFPELYCELTCL